MAGFSPDGKPGSAIMSIAAYPRWVSLFLSARLDDPAGLLKGGGNMVRHIVLGSAADLDRPEITALTTQGCTRAGFPQDPARIGQLVIKSVSAWQRPRRPA